MENFTLIILLTIACNNFKKQGKYVMYVIQHFGSLLKLYGISSQRMASTLSKSWH